MEKNQLLITNQDLHVLTDSVRELNKYSVIRELVLNNDYDGIYIIDNFDDFDYSTSEYLIEYDGNEAKYYNVNSELYFTKEQVINSCERHIIESMENMRDVMCK